MEWRRCFTIVLLYFDLDDEVHLGTIRLFLFSSSRRHLV